jgi:hypothetical protein
VVIQYASGGQGSESPNICAKTWFHKFAEVSEQALSSRQPDMPDQHAEPEDKDNKGRWQLQQPSENPAD